MVYLLDLFCKTAPTIKGLKVSLNKINSIPRFKLYFLSQREYSINSLKSYTIMVKI